MADAQISIGTTKQGVDVRSDIAAGTVGSNPIVPYVEMRKGVTAQAFNAVTVTGTSASIDMRMYKNALVTVTVTGGTSPTVKVVVNDSPTDPAGTAHWFQGVDPNASMPGIVTPGFHYLVQNLDNWIQLVLTLTGAPTVSVWVTPLP